MDNQQQQPGIDDLGPVRQLGHVVEDIGSSITDWQQRGVGPWLWMRNVSLPCTYLGEASRPVIDVALSYQGETQIELIQQINDAPSPYRQAIESNAFGLHHQAYLCEDIHETTDRAIECGLEVVCDIRMMGARYVYLQSADGDYLELLPASLMMRAMFSRGIAASKKWLGKGEPMMIDLRNVATLVASLPGATMARLSW